MAHSSVVERLGRGERIRFLAAHLCEILTRMCNEDRVMPVVKCELEQSRMHQTWKTCRSRLSHPKNDAKSVVLEGLYIEIGLPATNEHKMGQLSM